MPIQIYSNTFSKQDENSAYQTRLPLKKKPHKLCRRWEMCWILNQTATTRDKCPRNRLNADDRRGSLRGLDIISKVAYSGGIKHIYKISDTDNSCSRHIMCHFRGLLAVKMDAVSRGMHLLPAGYFATSTRCGSGADHPWTGSWTRIPTEDQSQRLIFNRQRLENDRRATVCPRTLQVDRELSDTERRDKTQRDINPSLVTFSCLHRT